MTAAGHSGGRGRWSKSGQAITEYLLLLLMAFAFFMIVKQTLTPVVLRLAKVWSKSLEIRFSKNLHRFR